MGDRVEGTSSSAAACGGMMMRRIAEEMPDKIGLLVFIFLFGFSPQKLPQIYHRRRRARAACRYMHLTLVFKKR